jgi:hypothetical protein
MFREVTMIELKEVLRLWGKGLSFAKTAPTFLGKTFRPGLCCGRCTFRITLNVTSAPVKVMSIRLWAKRAACDAC